MPESVLTPAPVSTARRGWRWMNSESSDMPPTLLLASGRQPASRFGVEGIARRVPALCRGGEDISVAKPRHCALQGGAVVVHGKLGIQCSIAFHALDLRATRLNRC